MSQETIRTFVARTKRGELGPDLAVVYRVSGGMPSQRIEYEIAVDSVDGARVSRYNARTSRDVERTSISGEDLDVAGVLNLIGTGLFSLASASSEQRLPDALLGSLTISVDGAEETFYFVPELEQRRASGEVFAPPMEQALTRLWDIANGSTRTTPTKRPNRRGRRA